MPGKGQLKQETLDEIKDHLGSRGLQLISYAGVNHPICVYCEKHGEITLRVSAVRSGSGCKLCANERISKTYKERAISNLLQNLDKNTELVPQSYVNSKTLATFKCVEHNTTYEQTPRDYKAGWRGCLKCRRTSKAEEVIQNWLLKNNLKFEREKTFTTCVNEQTNRKLPFDFYLPEHNMLVEYDGEHHYLEFKHLATDLNKRVYLDKIKTDWATKNNIQLIRIPYWEYANIETILLKTITRKL